MQVDSQGRALITNVVNVTTKKQNGISRDQMLAEMERKRDTLTELERLAIPMGFSAPTRESADSCHPPRLNAARKLVAASNKCCPVLLDSCLNLLLIGQTA